MRCHSSIVGLDDLVRLGPMVTTSGGVIGTFGPADRRRTGLASPWR
jgi:hypothetical protein